MISLFAKIAHDSHLGGTCLPSQNLSRCGAIIFFTCIGITHSWSCTFGASVGRWVHLVTAHLHPVLHACSRSAFWNRFFGLIGTGASLYALRSSLPLPWGRGVRLARNHLFRAPLGSTQAWRPSLSNFLNLPLDCTTVAGLLPSASCSPLVFPLAPSAADWRYPGWLQLQPLPALCNGIFRSLRPSRGPRAKA